MLQKTLSGLGVLILTTWIISNLSEKHQLDNDTHLKCQYLESFNTSDQFEEYFTYYLSNINKRESLKKNYSRFLDLDPSVIRFQDSIKWNQYIEDEDITFFTKEISLIPKHQKACILGLDSIRNKMIYSNLLQYIVGKFYYGGFCCESYFLNKDIYDNISLGTHSCGQYKEKITINGQSDIAIKSLFTTKLLLSETLNIVSRMSKQSLHQALNREDSIEFSYVMDIKHL